MFVVEKCLKVQHHLNPAELSNLIVLISAVPERGDAEGAGDGGPGGRGVQETGVGGKQGGGGKEVSHTEC